MLCIANIYALSSLQLIPDTSLRPFIYKYHDKLVANVIIIGASLSEPHIDELNARDPYIYY